VFAVLLSKRDERRLLETSIEGPPAQVIQSVDAAPEQD
jgi:hypothetical protein